MARIQTFQRDLQLATAGLDPATIGRELAAFARTELAQAIDAGEGSPVYEHYVNGRRGVAEDTVVPPGPIVYDFVWWDEIIRYALQFAIGRSPQRSGRYKANWMVMVNDRPVTNYASIPADATVVLVNDQPYHRKIDVGHMRMSVPHGIVEDTRQAVMRLFGNIVTVRRSLIRLPGGYVLKGRFRRGYREKARTALRADTQAGAVMTYPAILMTMRA